MAERARRPEIGVREREGITALAHRIVPVVQTGPFKGLHYPSDRLAEVDAPVAKFLGVYESEIAPIFENDYSVFVDVGCADGYYVVGMARRGVRSFGFDIARSARELCGTLAALNGVEVTVGKWFGEEDASIVGDGLLLVDIEGWERDLFTPEVLAALTRARVLIEVHEDFRSGTGEHLMDIFRPSHELRRIDQQPRTAPAAIEAWTEHERSIALTEHRPSLMHWLDCVPR